jgi:hypothetical protein
MRSLCLILIWLCFLFLISAAAAQEGSLPIAELPSATATMPPDIPTPSSFPLPFSTAEQLSPSAPPCHSPQWDLDSGGGVNLHCWNNVYVVSVDLRNPEVEVRPAEVYRPNALR